MTTFDLPARLEAGEPPATRDAVRLLVARLDGVEHAGFDALPQFLSPGDLVVVNTSATLAAAVDGTRADGTPITVHVATALDDGSWVIEVRPRVAPRGPVGDLRAGETITLPDGVQISVHAPHPAGQLRLWQAWVEVDGGLPAYLARHGRPIRYSYVPREFPLADYQTVFADAADADGQDDRGSAEMPSAGRPFTDALVTRLVTAGVGVAPVTLHTGVSSQDVGEPPQPERYRVPETTARQANMTRAWGGRVIAVGTTVTRALESAVDRSGVVRARAGWTDLVLGPRHLARVVNGLITGWHAPGASHLDLLRAVAGEELVDRAYDAALAAQYRWHEFGDSCLLLP